MTTTIVAKQIIRQGNLADMPFLAPGEFGLAKDEQRLFLGQEPIVGSIQPGLPLNNPDNRLVEVDFSITNNGISTKLDLETAPPSTYKIKVVSKELIHPVDGPFRTELEIPGTNITINDTRLVFEHGLVDETQLNVRIPDNDDTFTLYYNKEVTEKQSESLNLQLQSTLIEKSQPYGTPESTGIDFLSAVKNHITIEYYLHTSTDMRKGQLDIAIQGNDVQSITDTYNSNSDIIDVEFSISNDGAGTFTLDFDTTYTGQIQLNYVQKSFASTTSA